MSIYEYFGIMIQNGKNVFYQFTFGQWNFSNNELLQPRIGKNRDPGIQIAPLEAFPGSNRNERGVWGGWEEGEKKSGTK